MPRIHPSAFKRKSVNLQADISAKFQKGICEIVAIKSLWEWFIKEFRVHIADDENRQARIDDKLIKIDEKLARIEEWTAMNAKQNEIIHASSVKVNEIILEKIKSL
jgi:PHP family Zn ribbon phosphoesterase